MPLQAHDSALTVNVMYRTFLIKWGASTGTAFTIDHEGKQYLVTARHVVEGIQSGNSIQIRHEKQWKDLPVTVVGIGKGKDLDVAVLACSTPLSPTFPLVASGANLIYGQSVLFLGYPFGLELEGEISLNRGIPAPYVKAGIVSAMPEGDVTKLYLDAHNNEGFSGGPVVFDPQGHPRNDWRVAGVISSYLTLKKTSENTGIAVAIGIRHVVELIDANPIGFPLSTETEDSKTEDSKGSP